MLPFAYDFATVPCIWRAAEPSGSQESRSPAKSVVYCLCNLPASLPLEVGTTSHNVLVIKIRVEFESVSCACTQKAINSAL